MASAIILLPFYLHYLPVEEYGAMAVYTTFSMLLQILITYSFDASIYIHYHEYKDDSVKLSQFVSSAFVLISIIGLVVSLIALVGGGLIFDHLFSDKSFQFYPYGLFSIVTAIFQAFFKVNSSLLQSQQRPSLYFWSNLLSFSLIAVFTIGGLIFFPNTLIGPIGGRMLASLISGGWVLWRVWKNFGFYFNYSLLKESFDFNNSSFIYQVQVWLINNFDRFVITYYLTLQDVGVYDFAFKCMLIIDFIIGGLYNAFFPNIIGLIKDQTSTLKESSIQINRYYYGLTVSMMLLVSSAIFLFPLLIDLGVLRAGYIKSSDYLPYIGIVYLVRGIRYYFAFPYGVLKYVKPLPIIYLMVSIIKIGCMIILIKWLQVYAVIISAVLSGVIEILLLRISLNGKFKFNFNIWKLIVAPTMLIFFIILMESMHDSDPYLRHGSSLVFVVIVLLTVYRREIKLIKISKT